MESGTFRNLRFAVSLEDSAIDSSCRAIWITDAHRDDGQGFIVRADEKLTASLELERAVCIHLFSEQC